MEPGGNDRRGYAGDHVLGHVSHEFGPHYLDRPRTFYPHRVGKHLAGIRQLFDLYRSLNLSSGTGVAFTRYPATGNPGIYGDYLPDAQGEDVVADASPMSRANRSSGRRSRARRRSTS